MTSDEFLLRFDFASINLPSTDGLSDDSDDDDDDDDNGGTPHEETQSLSCFLFLSLSSHRSFPFFLFILVTLTSFLTPLKTLLIVMWMLLVPVMTPTRILLLF